jgi:hypothetical protein
MPFRPGVEEVLVQAGDVRGGRYPGGYFIETYRDFDETQFDAVVSMLGLTGTDDYDIAYDADTGSEIYLVRVPVAASKSRARLWFERGGLVAAAFTPMTGTRWLREILWRVIVDTGWQLPT